MNINYQQSRKPPVATTGVIGWLRMNLFSNWFNTLVTIIVAYFLYQIVPWFLNWSVFEADFTRNYLGEVIIDRTGCSRVADPENHSGACWSIIIVRFYQFVYGFYPREEVWRVNVVYFLLVVALVPLLYEKFPVRKQFLKFTYIFPIIGFYLLYGGPGLEIVMTNKWGGLLVTLVLGFVGIALAFPIGIILALGRRSNLPVISMICTLFIEFIRGVPLITLLFFGMVMLPLFLPEGLNMDGLIRVLVAVTLFQAAYMAEVIRGGLQAIPRGQYEAAQSVGLTYWQMNRKIILPQAIRITIPSIVNTSIGLFKDTTLVVIIGLLDLLGIGRGALADATWMGLSNEVYVFVAIVFFIFTFSMSRYSLYLEKKLKTGINMGAD
ncbi:MAG: Inner membrane amino-acid ABC transporter permease protein YhdY [Alphaproteobacteria bacterium MarineAlpha5_Bin5]|nr:MAG: Inner membrane amino-acid ABC transporter permease protein YhdY [Alphaproteobacteria bacterium MarineAlpha5_Bin5]PPR48836.1 MAG: Inner membrane amino-acid ABC transporter permease protein YhdY [Alphaproteobacteria bacterium MarineAlpha5_Bin4]|tara:strand:+ start:1269 stop:2408 length:1140 start_codon:yes stop_codon:yes gene_type:complete